MATGVKRNNPFNKKGLVMVFGVFDFFHKGHLSFLAQARKHGNVVAVIARDKTAKELKGREPHHSERARIAAVRKTIGIAKAILGDKTGGSYKVIKKVKPNTICLGYDQYTLEKDIRTRMKMGKLPLIKIVRLKAHMPKRFKTSIVAKKLRPQDN